MEVFSNSGMSFAQSSPKSSSEMARSTGNASSRILPCSGVVSAKRCRFSILRFSAISGCVARNPITASSSADCKDRFSSLFGNSSTSICRVRLAWALTKPISICCGLLPYFPMVRRTTRTTFEPSPSPLDRLASESSSASSTSVSVAAKRSGFAISMGSTVNFPLDGSKRIFSACGSAVSARKSA